jgi:hypothetical protein
MQEWQENSHRNSGALRVLVCMHGCSHRAASRQTFHDGVSWKRHKYAREETRQKTK